MSNGRYVWVERDFCGSVTVFAVREGNKVIAERRKEGLREELYGDTMIEFIAETGEVEYKYDKVRILG